MAAKADSHLLSTATRQLGKIAVACVRRGTLQHATKSTDDDDDDDDNDTNGARSNRHSIELVSSGIQR